MSRGLVRRNTCAVAALPGQRTYGLRFAKSRPHFAHRHSGGRVMLLPDGRMDVPRLEYVVGRTEAEIVHVIRNIGPGVRHARGNDDDVAGLDDSLDDVRADDRP